MLSTERIPFWDLIKYIAEDEKVLQTPDVVRNLSYRYFLYLCTFEPLSVMTLDG